MSSVNDPRPDEAPGFVADLFQTRYREVTWAALILAVFIGVIMNAAITYAGLKIGFTIGGSSIAAVVGFGVLRGIFKRGSIVETNIVQTIASAVNTSNSGVIFTVPVLFLIGFNLSIGGPDFWLITLACIAGAFLGTAFIIPLRKQMLDIERLRFPSPTAVAAILKSPGAGPAKAIVLVIGCILGAVIYLPTGLPAIRTAADLADLPALVESERISEADATRTRTISEWIDAEAAPPAVTTRGRMLEELDDAVANLALAPTDRREDFEWRVDELKDELKRTAKDVEGYNNELCRAAHRAATGADGATWDDLRNRAYGWAGDPAWGYADLDLRLSKERDETGRLTVRVDRDDNGRPDLVVADDRIDVGRILGLPDQYQLLFAIAPFALGAGYLTGRAGLIVLAGGVLAFFVLNPVAYSMGWVPASLRADEVAGYAVGAFNKPLGIGLLLGGAMMGVVFALPAIKEAVKSISAAAHTPGGGDELGMKTLGTLVVLGFVFLFSAAWFITSEPINLPTGCPVTHKEVSVDSPTVSYRGYEIAVVDAGAETTWTTAWTDAERDGYMDGLHAKAGWLASMPIWLKSLIIAIVGALWIWFAGIIISQCAGMTDWSPISGLALLTVVIVMLLAGTGAVVGAVLIGAALCVAITLAADMMGDLKTGYLVGAKPRRQQAAELAVVWIGPVVAMFTILLIANANLAAGGPAMGTGAPLGTTAPQAQALQTIITGMQGGEMPYALYGGGALLGALLGLGAFPGLGVLVGLSMYLPFMYISTYGVGCIINMIVTRVKGRTWAEDWGVPFAAGLIVGESILSLVINGIVLLRG
ncbi:MAG: OPT/YSL family transporter [Phycisphaerales bacterium]|nr:OPT/YSL family transporter [Phycisphaerales bacterium]